ncbi:hypothetical protein AAZV13_13G172100 [Glycine max]
MYLFLSFINVRGKKNRHHNNISINILAFSRPPKSSLKLITVICVGKSEILFIAYSKEKERVFHKNWILLSNLQISILGLRPLIKVPSTNFLGYKKLVFYFVRKEVLIYTNHACHKNVIIELHSLHAISLLSQ